MSTTGKKIVVAMSGGVDSSVTASLLLEQGHEVAGVSLRLWEGDVQKARDCSNLEGARAVADRLGIPHTLVDLRAEFRDRVVRPFAESYLAARTPNPCVACNRDFKLGVLLDWAREHGADFVATGHYARLVRHSLTGRASLFRAADRRRDQSYFLFALSQEQLRATLFPLGGLGKEEVRRVARRFALPVADRPDSQDICLGDYRALVESYAQRGGSHDGEIVDRAGKVLGRHGGVHRFTVGQRKGLGIAAAGPLYVLEIDAESKRVVAGRRDELGCRGLLAASVHWIEPPEAGEMPAEVQLRYRSTPIRCRLRRREPELWEVDFLGECPAVTPGQAAVFYRGEQVLGGGWIERAME